MIDENSRITAILMGGVNMTGMRGQHGPESPGGILRSRSIQEITANPSTTLYFRSNEIVEFCEPVWKYYNPDKAILFLSMEDSIKDGNGKYNILQKEQIDLIQFPDKEVTKMEEILSRTPCLTCYIPFGLSVPIDR